MSKIKEDLYRQNELRMKYYVEFMEFVCDQLTINPKSDLGVIGTRSSRQLDNETIKHRSLKPANNQDYFIPQGA